MPPTRIAQFPRHNPPYHRHSTTGCIHYLGPNLKHARTRAYSRRSSLPHGHRLRATCQSYDCINPWHLQTYPTILTTLLHKITRT